MEKLEQYLNQVCRGIGGPRHMREHIRQELREHVLDAVAQHQREGLSEEAALAKALEEFGKPDEVRSDLEGAHGQRMLGVVIDKALEWKEKTMKAKWLWSSWAHLALAIMIVLEVLLISFNVVYIIPRYEKILREGIIDSAQLSQAGLAWIPRHLGHLQWIAGHYTTWLLLGAIVAVVLFEWRIKSENKPLIRLSAWGTVAAALLVLIMTMSFALVVSFSLAMPAVGTLARPYALQQTTTVDKSVSEIEQALVQKDWKAMAGPLDRAAQAVENLTKNTVLAPVLVNAGNNLRVTDEMKAIEDMMRSLRAATTDIQEARQAVSTQDAGRLEAAVRKFNEVYAPVREAAKKVER